MDWGQILTEIILSAIGVIFSALGVFITYLINKHVKNESLKATVNSLHELIKNSVLNVYQTYTQELKEKNIFNEAEQKAALDKALALIEQNATPEIKAWLTNNTKDVKAYLISMIEASIADLKNKGGN